MSLDFHNNGILDPFSHDTKLSVNGGPSRDLIHIRNQQRNGRKSVTTVQGLEERLDLKKIVRALKKELSCNGTVISHEDFGSIIQLQGDKRQNVRDFLEREGICAIDQIRIHGA